MSFGGLAEIIPLGRRGSSEIGQLSEAMIVIEPKADHVANRIWPADDNPLANAPYTA